MQKIILCKGLPASGKTTWAKEYCINHPEFVRVNKDDIRELIGNPKFSRDIEDLVLDIEHRLGLAILFSGKSLIVDDTNFSPSHEKYWTHISKIKHILFKVVEFNTPVEECIQRDIEREKSVGKDVILSMYKKYINPVYQEIND